MSARGHSLPHPLAGNDSTFNGQRRLPELVYSGDPTTAMTLLLIPHNREAARSSD